VVVPSFFHQTRLATTSLVDPRPIRKDRIPANSGPGARRGTLFVEIPFLNREQTMNLTLRLTSGMVIFTWELRVCAGVSGIMFCQCQHNEDVLSVRHASSCRSLYLLTPMTVAVNDRVLASSWKRHEVEGTYTGRDGQSHSVRVTARSLPKRLWLASRYEVAVDGETILTRDALPGNTLKRVAAVILLALFLGGLAAVPPAWRLLDMTPLQIAASRGNLTAVETLLRMGADPNECSKSQWSPLYHAVAAGDERVAKTLLEHGARVDGRGYLGVSPLIRAVTDGNYQLALLLLQHGADVNFQGDFAETAIHLAAYKGYTDIVRILLARGADVDAADYQSRTALMWACQAGSLRLVDLLIKAGADMNARDNKGRTSLQRAACNRHGEIVKALLENGDDPEARDMRGQTALHYAAMVGDTAILNDLIRAGADANARAAENRTPLDMALENGQSDAADLLVAHGGKTGDELRSTKAH